MEALTAREETTEGTSECRTSSTPPPAADAKGEETPNNYLRADELSFPTAPASHIKKYHVHSKHFKNKLREVWREAVPGHDGRTDTTVLRSMVDCLYYVQFCSHYRVGDDSTAFKLLFQMGVNLSHPSGRAFLTDFQVQL